ncbi:MAG: MCE family protein [Candidatus Latescibacteria bacterium]|nr:MCE family protein [Candidatus Latescibacterota bacterium]
MNKSRKIFVVFFIVIVLIIIVFGYLYLAGIYPGIKGYQTKIYYSEVSGLKTGSQVIVRGIEKGKVNSVELVGKSDKVCVQITLDKDVVLTEDTEFAIRSLSYFGTDRILTVTPGNGPIASKDAEFYGTNEVIELERFFIGLDKIIAQVESIPITTELKDLKTELYSKLDALTTAFSMPLVVMSAQMQDLVIKLDTLGNLLKQDGTVKKLMTSEELYQEVRDTNQKLRELLEDIKVNPKKYFTVKIF